MLRLTNIALFSGVACALGLFTAGAPALAEDPQDDFTVIVQGSTPHPDTVSARVRYSDLDLTTASGQKMLQQRVRKAAHTVCGQIDDPIGPVSMIFDCEDQAVHKAVASERAIIAKAKAQTYAAVGP